LAEQTTIGNTNFTCNTNYFNDSNNNYFCTTSKNGNSRGQTDASRDTQGLNDNGVPSQIQAAGQSTSP
jgi:hypothetical protein